MIEMRHRISLDRKVGILQKLEVDDVTGILKINEDADSLSCLGFESGLEEPCEAKGPKYTGRNLLGYTHSI
jgi:hypothetical protein